MNDNDIEKILEGIEGEKIIREFFKKKKIHFFQVDLMAKIKNKWNVIEIKNQEQFDASNNPKYGPFNGHGLPKWQIEARLKFQEEMNIRALLFIRDKKTGIIYWQYMDILMGGEQYQTNGKKPRLIFPLENYNILEL